LWHNWASIPAQHHNSARAPAVPAYWLWPVHGAMRKVMVQPYYVYHDSHVFSEPTSLELMNISRYARFSALHAAVLWWPAVLPPAEKQACQQRPPPEPCMHAKLAPRANLCQVLQTVLCLTIKMLLNLEQTQANKQPCALDSFSPVISSLMHLSSMHVACAPGAIMLHVDNVNNNEQNMHTYAQACTL
jgi:hypothetical protein